MTLLFGPYDLLLDIGLAAVPLYLAAIALCTGAAIAVLRYDALVLRGDAPSPSSDEAAVEPALPAPRTPGHATR